jgi:hypothetical protein
MLFFDYLTKDTNYVEPKNKVIYLTRKLLKTYLFKIDKSGKIEKVKLNHIFAVFALFVLTTVIFYLAKPSIHFIVVIAQTNVSLAALAFILYAIIFIQHYNETRETIKTLYYDEQRSPSEVDANGRKVNQQYEETKKDKEFLLGNGVFLIIALFISALLGVSAILFYKIYWLALALETIGVILIELVFLIISVMLLNMVTDTIYVEYPRSMNSWKNRKAKHK